MGGIGLPKKSIWKENRSNVMILQREMCFRRIYKYFFCEMGKYERNCEILTLKEDESLLHGITRQSVIELMKANKMKIEEKPIDINDLINEWKHERKYSWVLAGTAGGILPIYSIMYKGIVNKIPQGKACQGI